MDLFPSEEMTGPYDLGGDPPPGGVRSPAGGGQRLVVDSLGTLFSQYTDQNAVRSALFRLTRSLKRLAITTLVTAERTEGYGPVARFGVKELVSDSVVLLRNALEGDKRRRTLDLLDMRGTSHHNREFPFTVRLEAGGVAIIPLASIALNQPSSSERISLGNAELDRICGGGLYRDSLTLVGGPLGREDPPGLPFPCRGRRCRGAQPPAGL